MGWKYYIQVQGVVWGGGKVGVVVKNDQVRELAGQVLGGSSSCMLKPPKVIAVLEVEMKAITQCLSAGGLDECGKVTKRSHIIEKRPQLPWFWENFYNFSVGNYSF